MPALRDVSGQRFGRLVVLGQVEQRTATGKVQWTCRCDCGALVHVDGQSLVRGTTTSCGCYKREVSRALMTKHQYAGQGATRPPEYNIWVGMKQRCSNPKDPKYPRYGGRGIAVCERWRQSFVAFFEDVGPRPSPHHSLHRPDNDGMYDPSNCRWATALEQGANTSRNRYLTYQGRTAHVVEWSRQTGLHERTISRRIDAGWSVEAALSISSAPTSVTHDGRTMTLGQWSQETGIPYDTLHQRICVWGWPAETALTKSHDRHVRLTYNGQTMTLMEWSKALGIKYQTLRSRLRQGWSTEQTLQLAPHTRNEP